jgi:hypothetical protein
MSDKYEGYDKINQTNPDFPRDWEDQVGNNTNRGTCEGSRPPMTAEEIVEQIMTMHWGMAVCHCWVCKAGHEQGLHPRSGYLDWRGKLHEVRVERGNR